MLIIDNLSFSYQSNTEHILHVFHDISFSLAKKETIVIMGRSGSGKSTLLHVCTGALQQQKGRIYEQFQGEQESDPIMALGLQDSPYFSWFNVLENIVLATPQKNRQRAYTLLKEVGLSEFASYYPQQLSGGMRQRVSIARTLAQNAGYIFLDEPFSALDSKTKQQLKDFLCIEQERREFGLALVLHNIEDAYHFADRILLLSDKEKSLRTIEVLGKSYETIQKEVLDIL